MQIWHNVGIYSKSANMTHDILYVVAKVLLCLKIEYLHGCLPSDAHFQRVSQSV